MRVALFPFGAGHVLAHPAACRSVARALADRGHEPVLVYGGLERETFADGVRMESVAEIAPGRVDPKSFARAYDGPDELLALVDADLAVLERLRPDAAVIDCRASAGIACELSGVPFVSLMHFLHTSPWRVVERWGEILRRRTRVRRVVRRVLVRLSSNPAGVETVRQVIRDARSRVGLDPSRSGVDGDRVACTTTPLLDPTEGLPSHWRYVGPVTWSAPANGEPPRRAERPLVYVTQGSTGSAETLARTVRELAHEPVDVLVTAAALCDPRALEALAPNVRAERLLPGRACMEAADVAVVHGGHLTTIEAHLAGTPVVVVPHGFDQYAWANRAERLGTGLAVRPPILPGAIRRAVRRVLSQDRYRRAAASVAAELRDWDGPRVIADLVEEVATARG